MRESLYIFHTKAVYNAILIVLLMAMAPYSYADSLDGKTLRSLTGIEGQLMGDIWDAFSNDKLKGNINSVKITRSEETSLELAITMTGLLSSTLTVYTAKEGGRKLTNISTMKRVVPSSGGGTKMLKFKLELDSRFQGADFMSPLLVVQISRAGKPNKMARITNYALDKNWTKNIAPENRVVKVKPRPIGNTVRHVSNAKAKETGGVVVLSSTIYQPIKIENIQIKADKTGRISTPKSAAKPAAKPAGTVVVKPQLMTAKPASTQVLTGTQLSSNKKIVLSRFKSQTPTVGTANSSSSIAKINPALLKKLPSSSITQLNKAYLYDYKIILPKNPGTPVSTEPSHEVSEYGIQVFNSVRTESGVEVDLPNVLGIENAIFSDSNQHSGVHYFIPKNYRLDYDKDYGGAKGLAFRISYDTLGADGNAENAIRMAMTLDSPLDRDGVEITSKLLAKIARQNSQIKFTSLSSLPLASPPQFDFSSSLSGLVESENISVLAFSDALEELQISWTTDQVKAENIRRHLSDPQIGVAGQAYFPLPSADNSITQVVSAKIDLADPRVYKAVVYKRGEPIRNTAPLPIKLKYLHALVVNDPAGPVVYSWSLGDMSLAAQASLDMDLADFPKSIEQSADKVWIDYTLDSSCEDCISDILDQILRADVWPQTQSVSIASLDPFSCSGAQLIRLSTRSTNFDPEDPTLRSGPTLFFQQGQSIADVQLIERIFTNATSASSDEQSAPLFEYRLAAILPSGQTIEGDMWVPFNQASLFIGSFQVNQSIPSLCAPANSSVPGSGDPDAALPTN